MAKRQSLYTESFSHSNPTPSACRMGPLLMSGIINGIEKGRAAGTPTGSLEEQCELMFARVREVMALAGGALDQIVKVNVAFADVTQRTAANVAWVALFPDENNRPVRHSTQTALDNGKLVQCDIVAWME